MYFRQDFTSINTIHIQNLLGNFVLSDYFVLLVIITLSVLLGVITYGHKYQSQSYLSIALALMTFVMMKENQLSYYVKSEAEFLIQIIIFLGVLLLLYIAFLATESRTTAVSFEISTLLLLAFFGILLIMENSEGVIIFVGLEIQAFTYYTLVSMGNKNISSAEGALKYFLLGAMASGLFILGISLFYGITGMTSFAEISAFVDQENAIMVLGALLIITGLLFKIGAVPFHLWLPDAYEGAPFYVLLFLVSFPKLGLFYLMLSLNTLLGTNALILVSLLLSAIVGSIQAVEQTKIKRFIAYSVVFNNAFFLSMVLLAGQNAFYGIMEALILYTIITVTTVLTIQVIKNSQNSENMLSIRDLLSVKKNNFFLSITIMVVFFSAAGIPPLLGFFQKYIILFYLVENFQVFLALFLIAASILPAFYYIRMPKNMYFIGKAKTLLLKPINTYNATVISLGTLLTLGVFY